MSEAKHTPGPWSMIGSTVYVLNGQKPPCNTFYATVQPGVGDDGRYIGNLEVIANANLMAAAPDLLAALQGMMKCFDDGVGQEWNAPELDAARAAIAKAMQPLNPA